MTEAISRSQQYSVVSSVMRDVTPCEIRETLLWRTRYSRKKPGATNIDEIWNEHWVVKRAREYERALLS